MAQSALIGAFLAGLLGGLHCAAMCGGYIAALSGGRSNTAPLVPLRALRGRFVVAHLGRILSYAALGLMLGATGGAAWAADWQPLQRGLFAAANVLLLALAYAVARGGVSVAPVERAGLRLYARVAARIAPLARGDGLPGRFALGLLWGLTPCALIYSVLPVALLSGSAGNGAAVMLAFGVGTLPNLVAAGWVVSRARTAVPNRGARIAAGLLIAAFALLGLWRAAFAPEAIVHGPFCIVP